MQQCDAGVYKELYGIKASPASKHNLVRLHLDVLRMESKHIIFTAFVLLVVTSGVHGLCNHGAVGICGPIVPFPCPPDSTCRHLIPGAPIGLCCINSPDYRCPPPTNMANACAFNVFYPNGSCMNNNDCMNGQICCPEACGGVCKDPMA